MAVVRQYAIEFEVERIATDLLPENRSVLLTVGGLARRVKISA